MVTNFDQVLDKLKGMPAKTIAVAWGHFEEVLLALKEAQQHGIARTVIFGEKEKADKLLEELGMDPALNRVVESRNEKEATIKAVAAVKAGEADVLMKGLCSTSTLLKAVLSKDNGLRGKGVLSHIGIFQVPAYHKLIILTDPAMNIAPKLEEKVAIVENAVAAARRLGIEKPKVAVITAVEKVNPGKMPATEDAAILATMNRRGQLNNCLVDGPLALDLAFSAEACRIKELETEVGGDTDIALLPDINSGNVFYKSLSLFAGSRLAGLVLGATAPIVLTSRADTEDSKFLSIAMALQISA
jgi:phosphate butyryltransferase